MHITLQKDSTNKHHTENINMKRELAIEFSRATEAAALAAYKWLGRGDKNKADGAAVDAMRTMLNKVNFDGEIVIGEGEIDKAPMLFIGEKVGSGNGDAVDIAVDPIEGTRMTAMGQNNAIAVMAASEKGTLLKAPDMYMEKLVCGPGAKGHINLNHNLKENIYNISQLLKKPITELTVITLAKERHNKAISMMHDMGIRIFSIPDGDVAASILTCMPNSEVDMMYCIGGAPEGVISASVIRALGGDMQAKLITRDQAKENTQENKAAGELETLRCNEMGIKTNTLLTLDDLASSDNVVFTATGITNGDLLKGVRREKDIAHTETLLIRGKSRTIRRINSSHYLDRKDDSTKKLIL